MALASQYCPVRVFAYSLLDSSDEGACASHREADVASPVSTGIAAAKEKC